MNRNVVKLSWLIIILLQIDVLLMRSSLFIIPPAFSNMFSVILAFFYLLVPGYLLATVLRLYPDDWSKKVLVSIGFSISFFMFFGYFLNLILPNLGVSQPLSQGVVLISTSVVILMLSLMCLFKTRNEELQNKILFLKLIDSRTFVYILPLMLLPFLSVVGTHLMNHSGNNVVLLFTMTVILFLIILPSLRGRGIGQIYPFAILMIGMSLLLMAGLTSERIWGWDIHGEYYVFRLTAKDSHWQISDYPNLYNAVLSVTIFPTVLQRLSGLSEEMVLKLIFPIIFSFTPLLLYYLGRNWLGEKESFLASMFFMSHTVFLSFPSLAKSEMGLFFLALSSLLLLDQENQRKGNSVHRLCLIIFSISAILSHYTTGIIYAGILTSAWIASFVWSRKTSSAPRTSNLSLSLALLFIVVIFFWYGQISDIGIQDFTGYAMNVFKSLQEGVIVEASSYVKFESAGIGIAYWTQRLGWVVQSIGRAFIGIGCLALLFSKSRRDTDLKFLSLSSFVFLSLFTILPYTTQGYSLERFYLQTLAFLSLMLPIGGRVLLIDIPKFLRDRAGITLRLGISETTISALLTLLVVTQLFFVSGIAAEIAQESSSIMLSHGTEWYRRDWVHNEEVAAARWLSEKRGGSLTFADRPGQRRLLSYGEMADTYPIQWFDSGYVYLRYQNLQEDSFVINDKTGRLIKVNITDIVKVETINRIYHNGESLVDKSC